MSAKCRQNCIAGPDTHGQVDLLLEQLPHRLAGGLSWHPAAHSFAYLALFYGRIFWVRPVGSWVLESNNVVEEALAVSLDRPLEWAVGFFFGNTELSLELWTVIAGISGFDD